MKRNALTLLELVVVMAIIGILVALLLPAVQTAREAARRAQCSSNLRQIAIALHSYEGVHRCLPPGNASTYSFLVSILPDMEMDALYSRFDFDQPCYELEISFKSSIWQTSFPHYRCPSDGIAMSRPFSTNYAGNMGYDAIDRGFNGVFGPLNASGPNPSERGSAVSLGEVADGLSQTAMVGEILTGAGPERLRLRTNWTTEDAFGYGQHEQFCAACLSQQFHVTNSGNVSGDTSRGIPWYEGSPGVSLYTHSLVPNNLSCTNGSSITYGIYTLGSNHSGGAQVAYADGHIKLISSTINQQLWRAVGTKSGND